MQPSEHHRYARAVRRGRRAAMVGFALFMLIDVLLAVSEATSGPDAGTAVAVPQSVVLITLDLILLVLVFVRGALWWRCLIGAGLSLAVSGVLLAVRGIGGAGLVEVAALFCLLLLAVRALPRWRAWTAGGLLTVAAIAEPLRLGTVGRLFAFLAALIAALMLTAGQYLRSLDERRDRAVIDVRRSERIQLARELHDFVAHHVTGIVVGAQAAQVVAERDPQRALASLAVIESAGLETLASMRRLVGMMRDEDDGAGSRPGADGAALRELVAGFTRTGPPIDFRTDDVMDRVPPDVAVSAHRIVLEALTNVRRHAVEVHRVVVDVRRSAGGLLVVVRDDGIGHRAAPRGGPSGGFGLIGLAERVNAIGGRLTAGAHADGGWEVTALLPITEAIG